MALFDFSRQQRMLPAGAMKQSPYVPIEEQRAPRQRRGLFSGLTRRDDGDPGTFLNYFLFGRNGVQDMRDSRMRRDMFNFNMEGAKREREQEAQQQRAIEEAIATLDPSMQAWARIAPNTAAQRALSGPEAPDWNIDPVTGRPYTISPQGAVQYGQGRVSVRPTGGGGGAAPSGYRWRADGSLEAVPGGPADLRAGESAQRARRSYETAIRNRENVLTSIDRALRLSNEPGTTGLFGQVLGGVGGTNAHDLQSEIDTVIGNIGFEALQEMRQNSPTGGALGQVAVRELELLQTTIANLRISQSREQFQSNLRRVRDQYDRTLEAYRSALDELDGGQAPAPGGADRVIDLEPR